MDIVERLLILLSAIEKTDETKGAIETVEDAADEIERLREALQFAHNNLEALVRDAYAVYANIQAALKEKE